jgi:hypothetical protein
MENEEGYDPSSFRKKATYSFEFRGDIAFVGDVGHIVGSDFAMDLYVSSSSGFIYKMEDMQPYDFRRQPGTNKLTFKIKHKS